MKHEDVKKVLVLGSAALKIGEAGEFDYSGSQAIKALKEEGIRTILINPNIATIQTSENLADEVYFLPVTPAMVERVIEKEKPDGILLGFGGQTALNCGLSLHDSGVLDRHGVKVLGTSIKAIRDTEDRALFADRLREIDVMVPRSRAATTEEDAVRIAREIGYPVMVRVAFALGGLGSGVCRDEAALRDKCRRALSHAPQVLVEECLTGWKEIEYEVVRDRFDNCITVCNMENFDPLGIHTGESIVVAPSQTLSAREYHMLRSIAIRTIRHLGIVGECNIQYALDPRSESYRVIEVNARLSRSSALASKATGYPLAFVATKLALGYGLHQLPNAMTKVTKAFFEPSLDYCVVKMPRWDLKKFRRVSRQIGSAMKSVGEVMSIGRTFEEAIQKAMRMLDIGARGLVANDKLAVEDIETELREPTEERILAVAEALRRGYTVERVYELTRIDKWFLHKIQRLVDIEARLKGRSLKSIGVEELREAKRAGFADRQIAILTGASEDEARAQRRSMNLRPFVRQIDTLAAEFPAQTNYLYLTYNASEDDAPVADASAVIILGSGVYRIGCSVEFDWCCVNAGRTVRQMGYRTVMVNYNPETVSTDYDESDLLFFDEISLESVLEIYDKVRSQGIIISMGGQIPNNIALKLHRAGAKILGTSPESVDIAEDRWKFSRTLDELGIDQPAWRELRTMDEAQQFATSVGFPVLVRPSYVLSGAAMAVASDERELHTYLVQAAHVSAEHPVVLSKFLDNAKEVEFDGVARNGEIVAYAICEHVENAGVHSGDATLVLPPQRIYLETVRQIRRIARAIAQRLKINGPFNIQFIAKQNEVKVIECNLRASRSFPFVSKILKRNFIDLATRAIMGRVVEPVETPLFEMHHVGVKAPQFSFTRLEGADPTLGVEMSSTGEVACLGDDFAEAFLKALLSVGYRLPVKSVLLSVGTLEAKADLLDAGRAFQTGGVRMYATPGTHRFLSEHGIETELVSQPHEKKPSSAIDCIREKKVDLVINIPRSDRVQELTSGYMVRRAAVDFGVPLITNRQLAARLAEAIASTPEQKLEIKSWSEYAM